MTRHANSPAGLSQIEYLERRVRELEREIRQIPSRWAQIEPQRRIQIIDGNLINNVPTIKYRATDPTLTRVYDPNVDTAYPDGIGRGWLMNDAGYTVYRVLVRHDFGGNTAPLMGQSIVGGWVYRVRGVRTVVAGSGPSAVNLKVYLVSWAL